MVSAGAACPTNGLWLPTQGCYMHLLFTSLFMQMAVEKNYASDGNPEQTNFIHDAQTVNWGSDFVKGPDFYFLNVDKTLNRETLNWGKLCIM
jgi:hypothetical protein